MLKIRTEFNSIQSAVELMISSKEGIVSAGTIKSYKNHFKCLSSYIDFSKPLDESACLLLQEKIRKADVSEATKNSYLRSWKTLVKFQNDPDLPIPIIRKVETVKETYTQDELKKMISSTPKKNDFCSFRNKLLILLLIDTGARSATIRNIKIGDIDTVSHQIVCRHTKNGKPIIICYGTTTAVHLSKYLKYRGGTPEDYLFCDAWGNELTESALRQGVEKYNKALGITGNVHKFRHTFAKRMLLEENVDSFTLMKMLGHSDITMTLHYCNLYNADVINKYKSSVDNLHSTKIRIWIFNIAKTVSFG